MKNIFIIATYFLTSCAGQDGGQVSSSMKEGFKTTSNGLFFSQMTYEGLENPEDCNQGRTGVKLKIAPIGSEPSSESARDKVVCYNTKSTPLAERKASPETSDRDKFIELCQNGGDLFSLLDQEAFEATDCESLYEASQDLTELTLTSGSDIRPLKYLSSLEVVTFGGGNFLNTWELLSLESLIYVDSLNEAHTLPKVELEWKLANTAGSTTH